ncbi:MAG: toll/interleukin-1 receptor domain-containing protein [Nitrospiraceae bacterium]|nr:MAG: toll/interleukin-1 receptor domain-containing protein [Nitrospiraceae bacterium]
MKIFISYSIHDKEIAGALKKYLEEHDDIECFIAHDDIPYGSEWEEDIISNLKSANYFMPLQTEQLTKSYWCQQEAGFAVAKGIKIIPLIPDEGGVDPVGFYKRFQGFRVRNDDLRSSVKKWLIKEGIITDNSEEIEKRIMVFDKSNSFLEAEDNARSLLDLSEHFTEGDILRIVEITLKNDQIKNSFNARKHLKKFFMRHSTIIPKKQLEELL